jgi:hypothetical protein
MKTKNRGWTQVLRKWSSCYTSRTRCVNLVTVPVICLVDYTVMYQEVSLQKVERDFSVTLYYRSWLPLWYLQTHLILQTRYNVSSYLYLYSAKRNRHTIDTQMKVEANVKCFYIFIIILFCPNSNGLFNQHILPS